MNNSESSGVVLAAALVIGTVAGLVGSGTAQAALYGVRVVDASGEPVVGASVCIGLEGNYRQFGALFTDAEGMSGMIDVPNLPLVVTVSKTRFAGIREHEPARGFDLVREIRLVEGRPGPRCRAGSSVADGAKLIEVERVDIVEEASATTLMPAVSGEPSHYRVALDESFAGVPWQRFESSIALPAPLAGAERVFLQLRRYEGREDGWLEARSSVVPVWLPPR